MKFVESCKLNISALVISLAFSPFSFGWNWGAPKEGSFPIKNTSLKDLYNTHRIGQPERMPWAGSYWAYASDGVAVKVDAQGYPLDKNERNPNKGHSPLDKWLKFAGTQASNAEKWEKSNHSCSSYTGDTKKSCEDWWGHCNAWSAAAIRESEPKQSLKVNNEEFSVADQKGLLTEIWMSSGALFAGNTDKSTASGPWIRDKSIKPQAFNSFWDISPRTFFLVLTNYVGIQKIGVVIDRFTGDEVWNQPIVGYRILPLRPKKDISVAPNGKYHTVFLRMKIYWANDSGTPPGHVTAPFDIAKDTDEGEEIEALPKAEENLDDYDGRFLAFKLTLDAPVILSPDGKNILSSGNIVGPGVWSHQEDLKITPEDLDHTHPDFMWLPTDLEPGGESANPYVNGEDVIKALRKNLQPAEQKGVRKILIVSEKEAQTKLDTTEPKSVAKAFRKIFRLAGVRVAVFPDEIEVVKSNLNIPIEITNSKNLNRVESALNASGVKWRFKP